MTRLGSIEAGGTKFVCSVSDENLNIIAKTRIPTTLPRVTMPLIYQFFKNISLTRLALGALAQ